jgi:quercetin dioxygenase-like cupin family protein
MVVDLLNPKCGYFLLQQVLCNTMKNFFDIAEIPYLNKYKEEILNSVEDDLHSYMHSMPSTERMKFYKILTTEFVKMYYIPIKYTIGVDGLPKRNINEVFNFSVDSVEQNQSNGYGIKAKEIEQAIDMEYYPYYEHNYFSKTTSLLLPHIHSSWVIFYKKGAVIHPHSHDDTTILTHILIEDITKGEFIVDVAGEKRSVKKRGDYFIFCGGNTHSAEFTGNRAKFITFSIELKDIDKVL